MRMSLTMGRGLATSPGTFKVIAYSKTSFKRETEARYNWRLPPALNLDRNVIASQERETVQREPVDHCAVHQLNGISDPRALCALQARHGRRSGYRIRARARKIVVRESAIASDFRETRARP